MQSPRVAIITRTKTRAALLRRAVDRILAQTFPDWMHWVLKLNGLKANHLIGLAT